MKALFKTELSNPASIFPKRLWIDCRSWFGVLVLSKNIAAAIWGLCLFVEADLRKEDIKHLHKVKRRDAAFKSHHKVCVFCHYKLWSVYRDNLLRVGDQFVRQCYFAFGISRLNFTSGANLSTVDHTTTGNANDWRKIKTVHLSVNSFQETVGILTVFSTSTL